MSFFALARLKNHKVPHLHPNSTMFLPLDRLQLKIYMHFLENSMLVLNAYFYRELRFVTILRSKLRFYSEIQELTQILLRISEEKIGGWGLCPNEHKHGWREMCSVIKTSFSKKFWKFDENDI